MEESITKTQQCASLLESDIVAAYRESCQCDKPSYRDLALRLVLGDLLADVRKLQSRLLHLGNPQ